MSSVFAERPTFFEGQYLGADDLKALLKYARESDARHLLGAHTWGVVSGIDLVEGKSPTGEVEYFLTPGVAIDGYGRMLVVTLPFKLTTDLFAQQPSGTTNVWIRYEQTPFNDTRTSFQSCECSDAFARVAESVVVEVGLRVTLDQRESGVVVGDQTFLDAREAVGDPLPKQPIACDGSVASQLFPDDKTRSLWLIPVGQVPWNKAGNTLLSSTEADKKASLIFRRVAGLVTGHIYPVSGVIRLRPRWSARQGGGVSTDQICATSAIKEADLVTCNDQLSFREMIWLEGHSRFTGDARLYGSRLEFQETHGTDYLNGGVPLTLRRRPDRNEHHGFDLQLLLGVPQGADGPTRLTIGKATAQGTDPCALDFQYEPGIYVQQDAKLGIGTLNTLLSLPLTIRAIGDTGNLAGFEAADGSLAWKINFGKNKNGLNITEPDPNPDLETRLFLRSGGNVGIGTLTPDAKLDIRNVPASIGNALGANKWFQVGDGDDKGRMWLQYGDQLAPLLVLSDLDNPPRLQFQQTGAGQETGPQFLSWIGQARNSSADLALMGGNVGVGTLQPFRRLHVEASEIHSGGAGAGFSFGNREDGPVEVPANGERWVWYSTGHVARLWSGGDKLSVTAGGNLGIATAAPAERLDVRGNIKLGAAGDFFGVGCLDNLRMIAGRVDSSGNRLSGSGFVCSRVGGNVGHYRITYEGAFSSIPVVVASLVDSFIEDNFLTVVSSTSSGFDLHSKDDDPGAEATGQDSAFNFIALGLRP